MGHVEPTSSRQAKPAVFILRVLSTLTNTRVGEIVSDGTLNLGDAEATCRSARAGWYPQCFSAHLLDSSVLQRLGCSGVLSFKQVSISIHHLHGPPAVPIHHLAHARSALQQRRCGVMSKTVEPHPRYARFRACSDGGVCDRVRVVRSLTCRIGREYVRRRLNLDVTFLFSSIGSFLRSFKSLIVFGPRAMRRRSLVFVPFTWLPPGTAATDLRISRVPCLQSTPSHRSPATSPFDSPSKQ
jgi:hypothetical protein